MGTAEAAAAPAVADLLSPTRELELGAAPEGPASHLTSAPLLRTRSAELPPFAVRARWSESWRGLWLPTRLLAVLEAKADADADGRAAAILADARPQDTHTAAMMGRATVCSPSSTPVPGTS